MNRWWGQWGGGGRGEGGGVLMAGEGGNPAVNGGASRRALGNCNLAWSCHLTAVSRQGKMCR